MQPINKQPMETPANNFYGVNVNNKQAVEEEFEILRKRHKIVTIIVIISLLVVGFFIYDYIRVTELGGKPIFVIEEKSYERDQKNKNSRCDLNKVNYRRGIHKGRVCLINNTDK